MVSLLGVAGFKAAFEEFKNDRNPCSKKDARTPYQKTEDDKGEVVPGYQNVFSREQLPKLTVEKFRDFLRLSECKHWSGLHRSFPKDFGDKKKLKDAFRILLDEDRSLAERFNGFIKLPGVGNAIASAILLITDKHKYGVWNKTSEAGLKKLDLWPKKKCSSNGDRYEAVNKQLTDLAKRQGCDCWTLDAVWWYVLGKKP